MPTRPTGVTDVATGAGVVEVDVVERASVDIFTTTTADPGTSGTSLAVTLRDRFPQSGSFKVRVEAEVMLVTAGHGTGAGTFTVTRAQDGTTGVAHTTGVRVAQVVGVQRVEPVQGSRQISYQGRFSTFRTLGRAAVSQKLAAIHNASGSVVLAAVTQIKVDVFQTAVKAVTIKTPNVRICRFTAVPTNGTALTKVPLDSGLTSNASITVWGDASADGTNSATTLTITAGNVLGQTFGPRVLTAVGYEPYDRAAFLEEETEIVLRANEGVCIFLDDAVVTTGNPATDYWLASIEWTEFTQA